MCRGHARSHGTDIYGGTHINTLDDVLTIMNSFMKYIAEVTSGKMIYLMIFSIKSKCSSKREKRQQAGSHPPVCLFSCTFQSANMKNQTEKKSGKTGERKSNNDDES